MEGEFLHLAREAILVVVLLSGPPVLAAMLVGLTVALFQALTQIQEQTLSMVGRIVAIFGVVLLLGAWMSSVILAFARKIFESFPEIIG